MKKIISSLSSTDEENKMDCLHTQQDTISLSKGNKIKREALEEQMEINLNFSTRIFLLSDRYNMFSSEGNTKV